MDVWNSWAQKLVNGWEKEDKISSLPADNIILALGFVPARDLACQLDEKRVKYRTIGDCRYPVKLLGAIHDGALAA